MGRSSDYRAKWRRLPDARLVHLIPFTIFRNTGIFLLLRYQLALRQTSRYYRKLAY
jgi:hypothetical protein